MKSEIAKQRQGIEENTPSESRLSNTDKRLKVSSAEYNLKFT